MLRTRIFTGLALALVVGVSVLWLDTPLASLVFALFWLVGAGEWARLAGFALPGQVVYAAIFAGLVAAVLVLGVPAGLTAAVLVLAALVWLIAFVSELRYPCPLAAAPIAVMGQIVLFAAWLAFYRLHGAGAAGRGLVLTGLVVVWSADIGAYFVGSNFGRTPLAPRVSPKKTWEGVAGGVALAALAGGVAAELQGLSLVVLTGTAAAMALVSVVGDLGVSMLKRHAGLKDSGVLLPGHGGVLDRFDGVTAALPFFALGLQFTHVLD